MTGHIHLQYDDAGAPILEDHHGTGVAIPDVTAGGIAEAIALAESLRRPLIADGWSDPVPLSRRIRFGSTCGLHYEFRGLSVISSAPEAALSFDAPVFPRIDWSGLFTYIGTGTEAVLFDPQTQAPGIFGTAGGGRIHKHGQIHLPFVYVDKDHIPPGQAPTSVYRFRDNNHALVDMRIIMDGVHGGQITPRCITVENPGTDAVNDNAFGECDIDFGFLGGFTLVGLQAGMSDIDHTKTPMVATNWKGAINADGALNADGSVNTLHKITAYVATFAEHDDYDIRSMSVNVGGAQYGMLCNSSAVGCTGKLPQIQADNSVYFGGSKCVFLAPDIGPSGPAIGLGVNGNRFI